MTFAPDCCKVSCIRAILHDQRAHAIEFSVDLPMYKAFRFQGVSPTVLRPAQQQEETGGRCKQKDLQTLFLERGLPEASTVRSRGRQI